VIWKSITLYAAGYDAHGNFRQDENADWTLTGELDGTPVSDTVFVFDPSVAPTSGTINAQIGTIQDATGTITVNTGALSSLLIRTESNHGGYQVITFSMTTDESQTFWSAGYDADGNYRGDEATTVWTSTGDLGLSGTGDSIIFTPSAPVSGTLIATVGGTISYETGTIMVGGGGVDHIIIRDAPDGAGNEVITHAMTTDQSLTLYAAGYDEGDTFVENTQVNWTLTGGLDGIPVSDTVFVFSPAVAPRSGTINAQIGTIQDATGTINVSTGALASLLIRDAANNGGDSVTTVTMSAGDSRTFYAAGYDADGNYRRDEPTSEWTSTFGLGGSGSSFLFRYGNNYRNNRSD
jgi:ABC-type cobalt transport system substrate-binding protein